MFSRICVYILFFPLSATAQGEFNNWHFGNGTALTFTPAGVQVTNSSITSIEGVAAISDSAGNLLFYTNGVMIWDRTHNIMQNGDYLDGHESSSQGVVIVPVPQHPKRYYVFTALSFHLPGGTLRYSIVNMNLNNGKGAVESSNKNIFITDNQTEKLVSVPDTKCGFWLISQQIYTKRFEARRITSMGIGNPVYSYGPADHTAQGAMKFTADNKKVVTTSSYSAGTPGVSQITLLDFDQTNGVFLNSISLPVSNSYPYGATFSPDGSKLYVADGAGQDAVYYQYDLSNYNSSSIIASKTMIGTAKVNNSTGWSDMQTGPDEKVYFARRGYCVGVIPHPNRKFPDCGFTPNAFCGFDVQYSLPNAVPSTSGKLDVQLGVDTTLCPGSLIRLGVDTLYNALWSTGATTDTIAINTSGSYWVTASIDQCIGSDTINISFNGKNVELNDTSMCYGNSLILDAGTFNNYQWNDLSTSQTLQVNNPGTYWVMVTNSCGITSTDTVKVNYAIQQQVKLPPDTTVCFANIITINATPGFHEYTWNDGSHLPYKIADTPSIVWIEAKDMNGCLSRDSMLIKWKDCSNSLWIPTAFTPNNDGTNDIFKVGYYGVVEQFRLSIYNRWGQLIFQSSTPDRGWDGNQKGIPANPQSFVWVCEYKLQNQQPKKESGTMVLIR